MAVLDGKVPRAKSPYKSVTTGVVGFTISAEGAFAANEIRVGVQAKDDNGNNIAAGVFLDAYLATDAAGLNPVATAPNGGVGAGAVGKIIPLVADKAFKLITDATGKVDVDVTDSGTPTFYLVICLPDGSIQVTAALTFA